MHYAVTLSWANGRDGRGRGVTLNGLNRRRVVDHFDIESMNNIMTTDEEGERYFVAEFWRELTKILSCNAVVPLTRRERERENMVKLACHGVRQTVYERVSELRDIPKYNCGVARLRFSYIAKEAARTSGSQTDGARSRNQRTASLNYTVLLTLG